NNPPICYAFHRPGEEEEVGPHPSMQANLDYFQPQSDFCKNCPNNEWGSAETGRGKACGERRRLAILPAGWYESKRGSKDFELNIIDDAETLDTTDIVFLKLPVMSVKEYGRYVQKLASEFRRPPYGAITR